MVRNSLKKLYWQVSLLMLVALLIASVGSAAFCFTPLYRSSRTAVEKSYENYLLQYEHNVNLYVSRLSDTADQISTRTRASILLQGLEKKADPSKQKELAKILHAALTGSNLILAIQRYDNQGKLVAAVGKQYPRYDGVVRERQSMTILHAGNALLLELVTQVRSQLAGKKMLLVMTWCIFHWLLCLHPWCRMLSEQTLILHGVMIKMVCGCQLPRIWQQLNRPVWRCF